MLFSTKISRCRVIEVLVLTAVIAGCSKSATPSPVPPVEPTPDLVGPMAKLGFMRGVWRGKASGMLPDRTRYEVTQTERMGPMLGGDIIVIEGRGYQDDGSTGFNAFAVVSWNRMTERYEIRSYAQGMAGTFELRLTDDGYVWEIPAGPGGIVRFTATLTDGHWREVGEYIAEGQPAVKTFEMDLERAGDTDWPLGTPITRSGSN